MAFVPIQIPWITKPPLGTPIDWSNPLAQGLAGTFTLNEGGGATAFDGTGRHNAAVSSPAVLNNSGYVGTGLTSGADKATVLSGGSILGGLANSSVFAVFSTSAATSGSSTTSGAIGTGGNTLYCERASSGNDIYKLGLANSTGALTAEFAYRNDAGTILQQRVSATNANNGAQHSCALVKNGTAHTVYFDGIPSSGTFGSGSTAFTNSGLQCLIGSDAGDANAGWNGNIICVLLYNRALSLAEIAALSVNPWQIYRPQVLWVDLGVGVAPTFNPAWARYANRYIGAM